MKHQITAQDIADSMKVVEQFISINGEGQKAGQLALFVRFAGCNLKCEYCDTKWANEADVFYTEYSPEEVVDIIMDSGIKNITLTGGEPLLQQDMSKLLRLLDKRMEENEDGVIPYRIEIETNGSVNIKPFIDLGLSHLTFTLDYKTKISGMEQNMYLENYSYVRAQDTVKFVVGSIEDMDAASEIVKKYQLLSKGCGIYFSPCFGKIEPATMVEYLVEHKLNGINVQLQMHKFIWDPDKKGV